MSTYWQRKKKRIRLIELEEMKKEIGIAAHRIDTQLCTCDLKDIHQGKISQRCKNVHAAAEMIFDILRKYKGITSIS